MNADIPEIINLLQGIRFDLQDEKALQNQLAIILSKSTLTLEREHKIDSHNIVDFLVDNSVIIEVKIKTTYSKRAIYKQCERYLKFDYVTGLILVTGRSLGFPSKINDKPCYVLNLSKAWL